MKYQNLESIWRGSITQSPSIDLLVAFGGLTLTYDHGLCDLIPCTNPVCSHKDIQCTNT
jgi:hypothetical protein